MTLGWILDRPNKCQKQTFHDRLSSIMNDLWLPPQLPKSRRRHPMITKTCPENIKTSVQWVPTNFEYVNKHVQRNQTCPNEWPTNYQQMVNQCRIMLKYYTTCFSIYQYSIGIFLKWSFPHVFFAVASGGFSPRKGDIMFKIKKHSNIMKTKKTRAAKW